VTRPQVTYTFRLRLRKYPGKLQAGNSYTIKFSKITEDFRAEKGEHQGKLYFPTLVKRDGAIPIWWH
jgi:hypothetical protein